MPEPSSLARAELLQSVYRRVFGTSSPLELGRFTVLERIGSGGMGLVFKAYDMQLDRKVALKVIRLDGATKAGRTVLVDEARALARLSHPNVVHVYEVGETGHGELYLAMEFVDGVTLRTWLQRARRPWREVMEVVLQAGEGLAAAHAAGLVHRDVKPDNIMVGDDGRVRVLDFGLACADFPPGVPPPTPPVDDELHSTLQRVRGLIGTPAYMAPEQLDLGRVGAAADQFGYCSTLFEALYGVRAFPGETVARLREAIRAGTLTVPSASCGVPKALHRALVRGLAVDPAQRHASMQVLLGELRRTRRSQRIRRWSAVAMAAMAVTTTAAAGFAYSQRADDPMRDEVVLARARAEVDRDPSATIAALAELTPEADAWNDRAFVVAEQAEFHGLPDREVMLGPRFTVLGAAAGRVIALERADATIVAIDVASGRTEPLIAGVTEPPLRDGILVSGRRRMSIEAAAGCVALVDGHATVVADLDRAGTTTLPGGELHDVAFAADCSAIAIRLPDRIAVHALPGGAHRFDAPLPAATPNVATALDADGSHLVVGGHGGSTTVYGLADGSAIELAGADPSRVAFASDGRIVTAGLAGGLRLWNPSDATDVDLGPRDLRHLGLRIDPSGSIVVTHTESDGIRVHDLAAGNSSRLDGDELPAMAPDGARIAWRTEDGRVRVLDLRTRIQRDLRASEPILGFAFAADGSSIVGYTDAWARRWPLEDASIVLQGHTDAIADLAFAPDGSTLYSAGRDLTLRSWDLADASSTVLAQISDPSALVVSDDGRWLADTSGGGTVTVRRADTGAIVLRTEPRRSGAQLLDGGLFVAEPDGIVRIDLADGSRTHRLEQSAECRRFALDRSRLVAACGAAFDTGTLRSWDLATGAYEHISAGAGWHAVFAVEGDAVVGGPFGEPLARIDGGVVRRIGHAQRWHDADVAGRTIAIADDALGLELHDLPSDVSVAVPVGGSTEVVALSRDGAKVAWSSGRRSIVVRTRTVPREPEALRAWVEAHRLDSVPADGASTPSAIISP